MVCWCGKEMLHVLTVLLFGLAARVPRVTRDGVWAKAVLCDVSWWFGLPHSSFVGVAINALWTTQRPAAMF